MAVEPNQTSQAAEFFLRAHSGVTHTDILSLDGLLDVAVELGITGDIPDVLNAETLGQFRAACNTFIPVDIGWALSYIAAGLISQQRDAEPEFNAEIHSESSCPVKAYYAAIELIDSWVDWKRGPAIEAFSDQAHATFWSGCYSDAWRESIDAAERLETQLENGLVTHSSGRRVDAPPQHSTSAALVDSNGMDLGWFTTFLLGETTLGKDLGLRNRILTVGGLATDDLQPNFVERLFPKSQYPDHKRLIDTPVEHVVGVFPILAGQGECQFNLIIEFPMGRMGYEVLTGEGHHTSETLGSGMPRFKKPFSEPTRAPINIPTLTGGTRYFKGTTTDALGVGRQATADLVGDLTSKTIVIVKKPLVSVGLASFRKSVVRYLDSEQEGYDAAWLVRLAEYSVERDSWEELHTRSIIDDNQRAEIKAAESDRAEERQREAEAAQEAARQTRRFRGMPSGGPAHMLGGGGDTFGLREVTGLHTGSGDFTGIRIEASQERLEPDPFMLPSIVVMYPFGVTPDSEQNADALAELLAGGIPDDATLTIG